MDNDRLGVVDEAFLVMESPTQPLHIGSIGLFEGPGLRSDDGSVRLDEIRSRVRARLGLLPRLRQRIATVPLDAARPVWVDDPDFDIANHIDAVDIGPEASETDLLEYVEELFMEPLDRTRPLWHLRLLTGLTGDRIALVQRAHHAMIDGVSGVDVSITLLDVDPDAADEATPDWAPHAPPSGLELFADGVRDRVRAAVVATEAVADALLHPDSLVRGVERVREALGAVGDDGIRAPACSLNGLIGPTRRIELVRQRVESVHAVGAAHEATINDVVLTAVGGGLRELFLARDELLGTDRTVHVLVPVSVRSDEGDPSLGNQVGGLVVPLPIGIGDPEERLARIAALTKQLKGSGEAQIADQALRVLDLLPPRLAHPLQHRIEQQPLVNMVVTNVPGPPFPLYALGSRMLEAFPFVPLGAQMTLGVAVLSYDGALTLGITSDRTACPDAPVFTRGVEAEFEALGTTRHVTRL